MDYIVHIVLNCAVDQNQRFECIYMRMVVVCVKT